MPPSAIYLSPHLDDVVYSCGGLIARQVGQGASVTVVTVCAGDPPPGLRSPLARELEVRWGSAEQAVEQRRQEDLEACALLGVAAVHIGLPDAIYRLQEDGHPLYPDENSLFGGLHPVDEPLIELLAGALDEVASDSAQLYAPLGIGGHVDHQLVRRAAEALDRPLWRYHDFPYSARQGQPAAGFGRPGGLASVLPLDEAEQDAWASAIWTYRSQRSTFWQNPAQLQRELEAYLAEHSGVPILAPSDRPGIP
jgi:LmbE family N-acetylglucosaminyl deacetylase